MLSKSDVFAYLHGCISYAYMKLILTLPWYRIEKNNLF